VDLALLAAGRAIAPRTIAAKLVDEHVATVAVRAVGEPRRDVTNRI